MYGKFMTDHQIRSFTAPETSDLRAVTSWLKSNDISHTVRNELVTAVTTVGKAEPLLRTTFYYVAHPDHGTKMICDEIILPEAIRRATASIHGLRGLPLPKRKSSRTTETIEAPVQVAKVTPTVIGATYSINGVDVKRGSNNRQAVAEFQGQYMNQTDLTAFFGNEVPTAKPGDEKVAKFVGADYMAGESDFCRF